MPVPLVAFLIASDISTQLLVASEMSVWSNQDLLLNVLL